MMIEYEASVVTGLEKLSAKEVEEKLCISGVNVDRGRVFFRTDVPVEQVLALRSIDNLNVILYREKQQKEIPENKAGLRAFCESILKKCNWAEAIQQWKNVSNFTKSSVDVILNRDPSSSLLKPAFRANSKRTGQHGFGSPDIASTFGACVNDYFNWPVNLKEFDLEVSLNLLDTHCYAALSLTKGSLHNRNLVNYGKSSLRSTICYGMLRLADLREGHIVVDPLCGSGALLIEACISWPFCVYLASDRDVKALVKTLDNRSQIPTHLDSDTVGEGNGEKVKPVSVNAAHLPLYHRMDIAQFDATSLPFPDNSIDRFVTDLPFGKRFGSKFQNSTLYPKLLFEMARCTKRSSGKVTLLTKDIKNMISCFNKPDIRRLWSKSSANSVNVGGIFATIYVLRRTDQLLNS